MVTIKEICEPRDRRETLIDLLHVKHRPTSIRIISFALSDTFPPKKMKGQLEKDEPQYDFFKQLGILCANTRLNVTLITRPYSTLSPHAKKIVEFLYERGVNIYYNSKIHAKTIIVSCKKCHNKNLKGQIMLVSSANLTYSGINKHHEIGVLITKSGEFEETNRFINQIIDNRAQTNPEDGEFDI